MIMETICSSETCGSFLTTQRYNPEDHTINSHCLGNLMSSMINCDCINLECDLMASMSRGSVFINLNGDVCVTNTAKRVTGNNNE
jgi:hypothetical protein